MRLVLRRAGSARGARRRASGVSLEPYFGMAGKTDDDALIVEAFRQAPGS
jgi:hypothetical protein